MSNVPRAPHSIPREVGLLERFRALGEFAEGLAARQADAVVAHVDLGQLAVLVQPRLQRARAHVSHVVAAQRELANARVALQRLASRAASARKVVVGEIEVGEHAILADCRTDVVERPGVHVHVESQLVVLHVERLDVLVEAQALEDRLVASRSDATVLE